MIKLVHIFIALVLLAFSISCEKVKDSSQTDVQTQRALAEAEANKQKALVAQAEKEKIEAELKLLKEKERIADEDARKKSEEKIKNKEEESELRQKLSQNALEIVQNSANQILAQAYPLAMNKLKYRSSNLLGSSKSDNGYLSTVRLNYSNLFNKKHYLDLQFDYDLTGGYRSWKFVNHSDMIEPKELTLGSLLKLAR